MCVRLWVAVTASHRFVLKLLRQRAFSKQSVVVGLCVCAFMGCCDSIPQVCFKVAATAHFFKTSCNRVCVCVHLWVAVTASFKLKASMFFFRFWVRSLPLWRCDSII